jgi:hypothetical protein
MEFGNFGEHTILTGAGSTVAAETEPIKGIAKVSGKGAVRPNDMGVSREA